MTDNLETNAAWGELRALLDNVNQNPEKIDFVLWNIIRWPDPQERDEAVIPYAIDKTEHTILCHNTGASLGDVVYWSLGGLNAFVERATKDWSPPNPMPLNMDEIHGFLCGFGWMLTKTLLCSSKVERLRCSVIAGGPSRPGFSSFVRQIYYTYKPKARYWGDNELKVVGTARDDNHSTPFYVFVTYEDGTQEHWPAMPEANIQHSVPERYRLDVLRRTD